MSTLVKRTFWVHAKSTRSTEIFAGTPRENFLYTVCHVASCRRCGFHNVQHGTANLIQRIRAIFSTFYPIICALLVCFSSSRHPVFLCSTSTISFYHFPFVPHRDGASSLALVPSYPAPQYGVSLVRGRWRVFYHCNKRICSSSSESCSERRPQHLEVRAEEKKRFKSTSSSC